MIKKINQQIRYLKQNSIFYKKQLDEYSQIENISEFKKFPFTTKIDIAKYNDYFLCVPKNQVRDFITTSGTIGDPISFYLTQNDLKRLGINERNSFELSNVKKGDKVLLTTTLDKCFMAGLAYYLGSQELGVGIIRTGPGSLKYQWDMIERFKPEIVIAVPSFLLKMIRFAKDNNIGKMEFLSCIPGSIGGAIVMNSGCYGYDISEILESVEIIDNKGNKKKIQKEEIKFFYRGTNLPKNFIIISAKLKGNISSKKLIEEKQNELIKRKKISQPSQIKTCGSTFKNNNKKAWKLIKDAGCDKFFVGDAKISEKHCNFFMNNGEATAADIETLINNVKKEVYNKTGINLELEIKIIGNEK